MSIPGHSEFVSQLFRRIEREIPSSIHDNSKVIVGVSGGPDSVALLRLMSNSDRFRCPTDKLIVVHCNHKTRPNSDLDEQFVKDLSQQIGVPFHSIDRLSKNDFDWQGEDALRTFRYEAMTNAAQEFGARYIVTGHTQDDQIETILFRILRGTGLNGLKGIPRIRVANDVTIFRPLLNTTRNEVIRFLQEIGQEFITDQSNLQDSYSRNFIRLKVLPLIESRFSQASDSILRLGEQAGQWEALIERYVPEIQWIKLQGNIPTMQIAKMMDQPSVILIQMLKKAWRELQFPEQAMNHEKWNLVVDLIRGPKDGTIQLPGEITISKTDQMLSFLPTKTERKTKSS